MLRVYAEKYLALGRRVEKGAATLEAAQKKIASAARKKHAAAGLQTTLHSLGTRMGLVNDLQAMSDLCSEVGLTVSQDLVHRAMTDPPQSAREFAALANAIEAELKSKLFLFVPSYRASYAQTDGLSLGAKAEFPQATGELRRAGVCYAFGEYTAAVFHAMRAAEICVRVLGTSLGVVFEAGIERQEWHKILNAITPKIQVIKDRPKSKERNDDLEFFGTAAAQLRFFNDGWRIHVAHAGDLYVDSQARDAIDHVRALIEILAGRLSEKP